MTETSEVAAVKAWMESLGFQLSPLNGWIIDHESGLKMEFMSNEQATFFYGTVAAERAAAASAALESVQDEIVLHYYDTTVGRKLEEFVVAQLEISKQNGSRPAEEPA